MSEGDFICADCGPAVGDPKYLADNRQAYCTLCFVARGGARQKPRLFKVGDLVSRRYDGRRGRVFRLEQGMPVVLMFATAADPEPKFLEFHPNALLPEERP